MFPRNTLFYGDNLYWLRDRSRFPDESVDLIYLDPPFKSNRNYNILFRDRAGLESAAQVHAFEDSWIWGDESQETFLDLTQRGFAPGRVQELLVALRVVLGENDLLAYLVMMTARLIEVHRVLKSTGSLYLHCDPTASHYLKIMLDAIFGERNFQSEISWKRTSAHSDGKQGRRNYGHVRDVLLYYTKSSAFTWNVQHTAYDPGYVERFYRHVEPETGRRYRLGDLTGPGGAAKGNPFYEVMGVNRYWRYSKERMDQLIAEGRVVQTKPGSVPAYKRYLDEMLGVPLQDAWEDIRPIGAQSKERLGYPTQKPVALLSRIIAASSNPGDVVLDAFCGCGTSIDASQRLGRRWVGIDVTILAIDLIRKRIEATFGEEVASAVVLFGVPNEHEAARHLFEKDPFEFERWLVTLVDGQPNERAKQVADRGIDGVIRFAAELSHDGHIQRIGRSLVSVKGGRQLNPAMVRELRGTVDREQAEMGLLLTLNQPTTGMRDEARGAGNYVWPWNNAPYPRLQIATVDDLLNDRKPKMPLTIPPYSRAQRLRMEAGQLAMF